MDISLIQGSTERESLISFLNLLTSEQSQGFTIYDLVSEVGKYYQGDRAYIFEKNTENSCFDNTYEWCNEDILPEIEKFQGFTPEMMAPWIKQFREHGCFLLTDENDYEGYNERIRGYLKADEVKCLILAPITLEGEIVAFMGVDNPRENSDQIIFMAVLASAIYKEIIHKRENSLILKLQAAQTRTKSINQTLKDSGIGCWAIYDFATNDSKMIANPKMLELLGITDPDMSHREIYNHWFSRVHPDDIPSVIASVTEMIEGVFSENIYRWIHPKDGEIYVRCSGVMRKTSEGANVITGVHSDVTATVRKEAEAKKRLENLNKDLEKARNQADAANNAKTEFLNNMSHDIRTPMNAILGFANLMEKELDNPEALADHLRKIKTAGNFLLSLINNVLEMAKVESGKIELDEACVCLLGGGEAAVRDIYGNEMDKKNLTFTMKLDVQHEYVYIDSIKYREIFENLLSNAIKYTLKGGHINTTFKEISSENGYGTYQMILEDDGIGMSEEYLPHIFEAFEREHTVTENKILGTGLGLPIVKKLVEAMHGTIEVESEVGKGSKFIVTLKLRLGTKEEYQGFRKDIDEQIDMDVFKGKHILLAEDNDLNAEIAVAVLQEVGFVVDRAEDGLVCVEMLRRVEPDYYDLILMDVLMPNMDGYKATDTIRHLPNPKQAAIPIIAMTANAFDEDKKKAIQTGMNGHVAKPIDVKKLMKTILKVLNIRHDENDS